MSIDLSERTSTMRASVILKAGACGALAMAAAAILFLPASQAQNVPGYVADVNWPKPLPGRWVLGRLRGICVDAKDHVLILNRQDVIEGDLNGGTLGPPMIEFDPPGNGGPSLGGSELIHRRPRRPP